MIVQIIGWVAIALCIVVSFSLSTQFHLGAGENNQKVFKLIGLLLICAAICFK